MSSLILKVKKKRKGKNDRVKEIYLIHQFSDVQELSKGDLGSFDMNRFFKLFFFFLLKGNCI